MDVSPPWSGLGHSLQDAVTTMMVGSKGNLRLIEVPLAVGQEDVVARCEPEHPDGMRRLFGGKFLQ